MTTTEPRNLRPALSFTGRTGAGICGLKTCSITLRAWVNSLVQSSGAGVIVGDSSSESISNKASARAWQRGILETMEVDITLIIFRPMGVVKQGVNSRKLQITPVLMSEMSGFVRFWRWGKTSKNLKFHAANER